MDENENADNQGKKPWEDGEFDAEKAWTLIQNLRGDLDKAKATRDEAVKNYETAQAAIKENETTIADLTATVQLTDDTVKETEEKLTASEQLHVKKDLLVEAGLPLSKAKFVIGNTEEEMREAVTELKELAGSKGLPGGEINPAQKPQAKRPGSVPDDVLKAFGIEPSNN